MTSHNCLLALAVLSIVALPVQAQDYAIDRGSYVLGGSAGFTVQSGELYEVDGDNIININAGPRFHYFVARGLGIGINLLVDRTSQGDFSLTRLFAGPTIGYFIGSSDSHVYPFIAAAPLVSSSKIDDGTEDISSTGFGAQVQVGAAIMLARNAAVTLSTYYLYEQNSIDEFDERFDGNTIGLSFGITAFIY